MAEPRGTVWLSWDLVFKFASLIILVFSGLTVEQISHGVHQVERTTSQNREAIKATEREVKNAVESVEMQTTTVATTAATLDEITPLFADVAQRQHAILHALENAQQTIETRAARLETLQEDLHALMALHQRLIEQCPPCVLPPPQ